MSRPVITSESIQMDMRSSPSQQHLNPSRSSSLQSAQDVDLDQEPANPMGTNESRSHKLDLYSVPVFILELLVLGGLGYAAYYIHFQHDHDPALSGFYCDDIAYRQQLVPSQLMQKFDGQENELTIVALLLAVPIVLIIFCELINSMFGALKFRQIRALCNCCKLHSITRRTIRFSGAYVLGFFIVVISANILANSTGRLRPYFAQECPVAYTHCRYLSPATLSSEGREFSHPNASPSTMRPSDDSASLLDASSIVPPSSPIGNLLSNSTATIPLLMNPTNNGTQTSPLLLVNPSTQAAHMPTPAAATLNRPQQQQQQQQQQAIIERQWIDLTGHNLKELCQFSGDEVATHRFQQLAMSWPSFPAAIFSYAFLYIAIYLCFVGTARPFRIITSVLVMVLFLLATMFDVQVVKEHYNHWDDVAAGSFLAFVVVIFVLLVYLNKFKDTHYYENQKLQSKARRVYVHENFKPFNNDSAINHTYNLDKMDGVQTIHSTQNGETTGNELAMRYFQIPRANYRGAPRPLSSIQNQIR